MLTTTLLVVGMVLIALTLADKEVRRLPLSPALVYLVLGWATGALFEQPDRATMDDVMPRLVFVTEAVVLISLFAVGLRLKVPATLRAWRPALLMAAPGMLVAIGLAALLAHLLLGFDWAAALLLGAILAPTDPVLASEVQIRADGDRDAVRLNLTAEGGLNDGTAMPVVMLALGLLGLHDLGVYGARWWSIDLLRSVGGGALLGALTGLLIGRALAWRFARGDKVARDELLYLGVVTLTFGLARLTHTSTFVSMFAVGVTLLWPLRHESVLATGQVLSERMHSFGARIERLVEAAGVLAVGVSLYYLPPTWSTFGFGILLVLMVRPLSVFAVIWPGAMTRHQRRLLAWFGIRGIGSLYYLAYALEHGVNGVLGTQLASTVLTAIAVSILLHGVSATPVMASYQLRRLSSGRRPRRGVLQPAAAPAPVSVASTVPSPPSSPPPPTLPPAD